jgi:kynurenine formamidase
MRRWNPGKRLVDLSHEIEHGLETYRGLPPPRDHRDS